MSETNTQVVALLGESLLMDTLEVSLNAEPDLNTVRLSPDSDKADPWSTAPNLIITDLNALQQRTIFSYLRQFPHTPMVGIDVTSHRVIAISCETHSVQSTEDLIAVIRTKISPSTRAQNTHTNQNGSGCGQHVLKRDAVSALRSR